MKKQWVNNLYYVKEIKNRLSSHKTDEGFYYTIHEKSGQKIGEIIVSDKHRLVEEVNELLGIEKTNDPLES